MRSLMTKERIRTPEDTLLWVVDCNLATIDSMATLKSRPKREYERQLSIAQTLVDKIMLFEIELDKGNRVVDVINDYNGSVEKWAKTFEEV